MKKPAVFLLCFAVSTACFSQRNLQISVGVPFEEYLPSLGLSFSETDSATFERSYTPVTASVLFVSPLSNPKMGLRYGVGFRNSHFYGEMRFYREVEGYDKDMYSMEHSLPHSHGILDINLPVDFYYRPSRLFYTFFGVYPTFRIDFSRVETTRQGTLPGDQVAEVSRRLKAQVLPFGFNYRLGVGIRHKFLGVELSYEQLVTNALKKQFEWNGKSLPTHMTYSSFFCRLVFHIKTKRKNKDSEG